MEKLQTKYFTRADIKAMGLSTATLDLWAKRFRRIKPLFNAPWVWRPIDERLLRYSEDFVAFLQARKGKTGPASLPTPERIVLLFTGTRAGWTLEQITEKTGEPLVTVQMQLDYLEVKHAAPTQTAQS